MPPMNKCHVIFLLKTQYTSTHTIITQSQTYQTWRTKQLQRLKPNPFHLLSLYHRTSTPPLKLLHMSVRSWRRRTGAPPRRSRFTPFSWFFSVSYLMGLRYFDSFGSILVVKIMGLSFCHLGMDLLLIFLF